MSRWRAACSAFAEMSTAITPGEVVAVGRRDVGFLGRVGGDGCGGGCDIVPGLVYGWRRRRGSARWSRTVRCSGRRTGCGQRLPRPRSSSGCQAGHADAVFGKVDTEARGCAGGFGISSIPTLMVIRDGIILLCAARRAAGAGAGAADRQGPRARHGRGSGERRGTRRVRPVRAAFRIHRPAIGQALAAMRSSPDSNMKMGGMATVASRGPLLRPGRGWQVILYTPTGIVSL